MIYVPLTRFKLENNNERLLQLMKKTKAELIFIANSYWNLSNAYQGLGQFKTAIEYHQRHLEIAKEGGGKAGEGRSYGNLGNAYKGLGEFTESHQVSSTVI